MQVVVSRGRNSNVIGSAYAVGLSEATMCPSDYVVQKNPHDVVIYGLLRRLQSCQCHAIQSGKDWVYMDNGYMEPGHWAGNYSITYNWYQHTGEGDFSRGKERFKRMDAWRTLYPWRKSGDYILLLPPTEAYARLMKLSPMAWVDDTIKKLQLSTDRQFRIRAKPGSMLGGKKVSKTGITLEEDLSKAYAMVTYNSKAAIESIVRGVPVFMTLPGCAVSVGLDDISLIETPYYPEDRQRWLHALAANQFSIAEMEKGYPQRVLEEDLQDGMTNKPLTGRAVPNFFT